MKIAVAAACFAVLAGCSSPTFDSQPMTVTGGATYSCWQDRLSESGDFLVCNWERSQDAACESHNSVSLPKASFIGAPQRTRRCNNGQWLVSATSR